MIATVIFIIIAFLVTLLLVDIFVRFSKGGRLVVRPNDRGSHVVPTPSGGGVVIYVVAAIAIIILGPYFDLTINIIPFLAVGGLLTAIGFLDDLRHISLLFRLIVHFVAAGITVYLYLGAPRGDFALGGLSWIIWTGLIVLFINIYNFLDGSDGMVALQSVVVFGFWFVIALALHADTAILPGILLGAWLGFLINNWHPARLFMGDAGSTFVGYSVATIPLMLKSSVKFSDLNVGFAVLALSSPFVLDGVATRVKLAFKVRRFWEPNRQHAYQIMIDSGFDQRLVALIYSLPSLVIAVVMAWLFST